MISIAYLLEVLKLTLAGIIVFFTAWYFIRDYLDSRLNLNVLELKRENIRHILPLRLQAYERTILFLERINPANMLIRLHNPGMSAREMQGIIVSDIRAEYQHNVSQQIYVNGSTWNVVRKIKDDTISIVNSAVNALPEDASAGDLSKSILMHLSQIETDNPYDTALEIVKQDLRSLY
jgi:hypothetical protein